MEEVSSVQAPRPHVPVWLTNRQLNEHLLQRGLLPAGVGVEDVIEFLDEENDYDGIYSPDLLVMLNGVDRGFISCLKGDPIFYREIFEPWYFNMFAPRIFDCKLPFVPPKVEKVHGNGGALFLLLVVAVIAAGWYLFTSLVDITTMWKMLRALRTHEAEEQQSAESAKSGGDKK